MKNDLTVLYVEDDSEILENVSFLLGRYVKEVYNATDGEAAIVAYNENNPDLLVTDINIPKISGLEVVEHIRKENKNIPVVVITAHDDEEFLLKAKELNVSTYVKKPFTLHDLTQAMEKAIAEK